MFWAVRRAMLRGMLAAWSKLEASATICSTLLGAVMSDGDVLLLTDGGDLSLLLLLAMVLYEHCGVYDEEAMTKLDATKRR